MEQNSLTLLRIVKSRRSVRFYKSDLVPEEHIIMILEAARWAPSGANTQPWIFIVVKEQETKRKLMEIVKKQRRENTKKYPNFPWRASSESRDPELLIKVPVVIAVCLDHTKKSVYPTERKDVYLYLAGGAAIQNMLLMATALGLGSLWLTPEEEGIKELLEIPRDLELIALIPIGFPTKPIGSWYPSPFLSSKNPRYPLENIVYYEKFGCRKT